MSGYAVSATAIGMGCLFLGLAAWQGLAGKTERRLFLFMTVSLAWFLVSASLTYGSSVEQEARFWYRISSFGFAPFFALHLHFCFRYTGLPLPKWGLFFLYVPAPVVIASTWFSRSVFDRFERLGTTWKLLPAYDSFWFWFFIVYYVSMILASIAILLWKARHTDSLRFRNQLRVMAVSAIFTVVIGSLFDFVISALPTIPIPPLGALAMVFYVAGLWYALCKYHFLGPRPEVMLEEILENFGDFVFLLDDKFQIKRMNRPALKTLFPSGIKELGEFATITLHVSKTRNYLEDVRQNGFRGKSISLDFRTPKGTLHANGVIYKVCKSVKEPDGYLVFARENQDRKRFIQTFKLTTREMEIVDLCLKGESNPDIAPQLGISLRTVESHLLHIYNKCGVDNKIELFNLCRTYSLLPESADTP